MRANAYAARVLEGEAGALLARLRRVKPAALQFTSVPAAAVSLSAQAAIEDLIRRGRGELERLVGDFLEWLRSPEAEAATPEQMQRRFTFARLRFHALLSRFDVFADVLTQRSEQEFGVWLGGLDALATDALALPGYYDTPPVVCYLDRGHGAAIRRVRTRLPGGEDNPVAVIRVPRERMVGSGIGSSLVHEAGHQAAELLDLLNSMRMALNQKQQRDTARQGAWAMYERWISEILADFWSVARLGVASTMGLIGVVSLPRAFVFRMSGDDPHPFPWIRVKISAAIGATLYPHPQWAQVAALWESYYPPQRVEGEQRELIALLEDTLPDFAAMLANHRPRRLGGQALREVLSVAERQPERLIALWKSWRGAPAQMREAAPTLALAALGQARADGTLEPERESRLVSELLTYWALRATTELAAAYGKPAAARALAVA
jgi:hypothetical protein